jgi:hypothetical protein
MNYNAALTVRSSSTPRIIFASFVSSQRCRIGFGTDVTGGLSGLSAEGKLVSTRMNMICQYHSTPGTGVCVSPASDSVVAVSSPAAFPEAMLIPKSWAASCDQKHGLAPHATGSLGYFYQVVTSSTYSRPFPVAPEASEGIRCDEH